MARHGVTGVLLVGGASRRFGSPKALARFEGETLAERAYRVLGTACDSVIAVGKTADGLPLPFPVVDDRSEIRAAMVGLAAGLRAAKTDLCLVLPVDLPHMTPDALRLLADGAENVDAAVPQTGPLPGVYRRSILPVVDQRIEAQDFALHRLLGELQTRVVELDESLLRNVNEPSDLR
ncbi:MAG TPA: molybdenum cofactor guanylyltransferase [Gaiellaceae bacterium]|nr:molybdenum cofactor guanylyltransferase [Gaiellaceae bacterium]